MYSADPSRRSMENVEAYREWKAGQITATDAIRRIGMKKPTFYRRVKEYEEINEPF
ncbi:hypothetical protein BN871_AE_00650 [Paenibacillus sp. P22]|nr:hypothetical protein BN871_AE_00650 [Paenibacillus sp. P22]